MHACVSVVDRCMSHSLSLPLEAGGCSDAPLCRACRPESAVVLPLREAAQVTASGEEIKDPKVPYQVIFTPEKATTAAYEPVRKLLTKLLSYLLYCLKQYGQHACDLERMCMALATLAASTAAHGEGMHKAPVLLHTGKGEGHAGGAGTDHPSRDCTLQGVHT